MGALPRTGPSRVKLCRVSHGGEIRQLQPEKTPFLRYRCGRKCRHQLRKLQSRRSIVRRRCDTRATKAAAGRDLPERPCDLDVSKPVAARAWDGSGHRSSPASGGCSTHPAWERGNTPFCGRGAHPGRYADLALIPQTLANPDIQNGVATATAETTRQILLKRGISDSKIVMLSGTSDSTFGDAQALSRYFEQTGAADVLVVTNAYHSRRARWVFRQVLQEHLDRLRFYSAPNGFDARIWWQSRAGRQAVLSEWMKFLFYILYYGRLGCGA